MWWCWGWCRSGGAVVGDGVVVVDLLSAGDRVVVVSVVGESFCAAEAAGGAAGGGGADPVGVGDGAGVAGVAGAAGVVGLGDGVEPAAGLVAEHAEQHGGVVR